MRTKLLIAGFMMAVALPATALAQPYDPGCVQQNRDNRAAGTVVGAIGGALIGGAIGGRHNAGAGAVIGGVTGAVAGNAIAGSNNHPCPEGYYYAPPPARDDGRYNDGRYNDGRYNDGRYNDGRYNDGRYDRPTDGGDGRFWAGAPTGVHERIDFMQTRINDSASRGWVSRREISGANRELNFIRSEDRRLRYQSGGRLRPEDRDYLQGRLDALGQRLHWAQHND
jgi:hypothetical protein